MDTHNEEMTPNIKEKPTCDKMKKMIETTVINGARTVCGNTTKISFLLHDTAYR